MSLINPSDFSEDENDRKLPMDKVRNQLTDLRTTVERIISESTVGNIDLSYDLGVVSFAGPDGGFGVGYGLILSCKSPMIQPPRLCVSGIIPDGYPSEAQLKASVDELVKQLFQFRMKILGSGRAN